MDIYMMRRHTVKDRLVEPTHSRKFGEDLIIDSGRELDTWADETYVQGIEVTVEPVECGLRGIRLLFHDSIRRPFGSHVQRRCSSAIWAARFRRG
jgi:hypothetical protein